MIISEQFLKSIPLGNKNTVLNKLKSFEVLLKSNENIIREMPAGFWVRNIKNTDVFKFRLNNKDRILFVFIHSRNMDKKNDSDILFLKYVTHDEQIRIGNNISINYNKSIDIDIDSQYNDDILDNTIEEEIISQNNNGKVDISLIPSIVVDEYRINQILQQEDNELFYYLSDEQYKVLEALDKPILLSGAGGTGKTVVLLNVLALASKEKANAIYISKNSLLVNTIMKNYNKFIIGYAENFNCKFKTLKEVACENQEIDQKKIVSDSMITSWVEKNIKQYRLLRNRDLYEIISEIRGVLKGYLGLEYSEIKYLEEKSQVKMDLDKYLNVSKKYSNFSEEEKNNIYKLTDAYDRWLISNGYLDNNDVARLKIVNYKNDSQYDWVIVDEVQDLSEVEIYMISKLVKNDGHVVWAGDINQTIVPTFFNYGRVKNLYYTYNKQLEDFTLNKNYRATKEIISLINDITDVKTKVIGKSSYDYYEEGIRNGNKPMIIKYNDEELDKLMNNIQDKHYCAVIVANEKEKEKLINKYPSIESRIFLIYEIKGLEYKNILCYNVLSAYSDIWKSILSAKYKRNNRMKYYFNILYVAISRAKNSLYFYEENLEQIDFKPLNQCIILDKYNASDLDLVENSQEENWKEEVARLEEIGLQDKAKLIRDLKLEKIIESINKSSDSYFEKIFSNISQDIDINSAYDEEMKSGIIEYRKRNYTGAIEIFNKLLEKYNDNSKLYYCLANAYAYQTGGMEYSLNFYEKAIELDSEQYEYYLDMAAILKVINRNKDALEILTIAKKKFPEYGNADEMMAGNYIDMGNMKAARSAYSLSNRKPKYKFDTLLKIWEKPKVKINKKDIDNEKVIDEYYLEEKNFNKPILSGMSMPKGIEYIWNKEHNNLTECTENNKLVSVDFNRKSKRYIIEFDISICKDCCKFSKCIASRCNSKKKISIKETIIKSLTKNYESVMREKCKDDINNEKKIINNNESSLLASNYDTLLNKVTGCMRMNQYEEAIYLYKFIIEKKCTKHFKNIKKIVKQIGISKFSELSGIKVNNFRDLKSFLTAELYNNLGRAYKEINNMKNAKECLIKAIEISPKNYLNSYLSLGDVFYDENNFDEALKYYSRAVELGESRGNAGIELINRKKYIKR